jgi:hypothetical protein
MLLLLNSCVVFHSDITVVSGWNQFVQNRVLPRTKTLSKWA